MRKRRTLFLSALLLLSSVPALAQGARPSQATPVAARAISIRSHFEGEVLVSTNLNGHTLWFELDTSAQGLVLDPSTVQSLGLVPSDDGSVVADIAVGAFQRHQAAFSVKNINQSATVTHVAGLLGAPFFESGIVRIDFLRQSVSMFAPDAFVAPATDAVEAPISILGHLPFVHAWFDDTRAAMLLDTDASSTSVFDKFSRRIALAVPSGDNSGDQVLGRESLPENLVPYTADSLAIGGVRLRQVPILISPVQRIFDPGVYADGTLGRDILANFILTLDYPESKVYFSR